MVEEHPHLAEQPTQRGQPESAFTGGNETGRGGGEVDVDRTEVKQTQHLHSGLGVGVVVEVGHSGGVRGVCPSSLAAPVSHNNELCGM